MLFLGTAAAECFPNPFCECPSCKAARLSNDRRQKRRRSSFLFDETTMIDCNADAMFACAEFGVSLSGLRHVLLTHIHEDHFDYFNAAFPNMAATPTHPLTFYTSEIACAGLQDILERVKKLPHPQLTEQLEEMAQTASFVPLQAYRETQIGALQVVPVFSNHAGFFRNEQGYNYLIKKDGKTTFYAADTGRFLHRTMQFLRTYPIDTLIIEGSFGKTELPRDAGHLNCASLCEMLDQMFAQGSLHGRTQIYVTHIGHKGIYNLTDYQEALEARYRGQVRIAWDGLEI